MREIEFRVWDNQEKVYLNKRDIAIDNLGNIFVFEGCDDNDADLWHVRILSDPDNERYVIEQTTGLIDKNGTEIYEGDIISYSTSNGFSWGTEAYDVVVCFDETGVRFVRIDTDTFIDARVTQERVSRVDRFEIIGNIHENPELLEEK